MSFLITLLCAGSLTYILATDDHATPAMAAITGLAWLVVCIQALEDRNG